MDPNILNRQEPRLNGIDPRIARLPQLDPRMHQRQMDMYGERTTPPLQQTQMFGFGQQKQGTLGAQTQQQEQLNRSSQSPSRMNLPSLNIPNMSFRPENGRMGPLPTGTLPNPMNMPGSTMSH